MRRLALLLALLVAVLGVAAGCGGGGSEDRTEGLTPDQILAQSRQAVAALTSYRVALTARADVDATRGAVDPGVARLIRDPIEIEGEGVVERPDSVSFDLTASLGALPVQANVTKIGGDLYLTALGQDFKLDLPAGQVALVRPAEAAPALVGWLADPEEVGREEVGGAPTVHLTGGVDVDAAVADIGGLLAEVPGLAGEAPEPGDLAAARRQLRAALREGRVDVWIGTEDLLPRRVVVDLRLAGATAVLPGLRRVALDLEADLSDFDEDVSITAPANPQTLDPGGLADLAP